MKKIIVIIILQLLLTDFVVGTSLNDQFPKTNQKGTIYVGGTGPGNYSKIQDAIDNATTGDTVFVYSGFYFENIIINASINLMGEHRNTTVIDGMEKGTVVTFFADNILLCNFSVQNACEPINGYETGINIQSNGNTLKYNIIGPKNSAGIGLSHSNNNTIYRNTFYYNRDALILSDSNYNEIIENTIGFSDVAGIDIWDSHDNLFQRNNFIFNTINTWIMGNSIELNTNYWEENYWSFPIFKAKKIPTFIFPFKIEFQYDQTPAVRPNGRVILYTFETNNTLIRLRGRVQDLFNTSSWDGVGLKIGRLSSIGIIVNNSFGERLRVFTAEGLGFSWGSIPGYSELLLEDAIGIFWRPLMNLRQNMPPRIYIFCLAGKVTETFHSYSFYWD